MCQDVRFVVEKLKKEKLVKKRVGNDFIIVENVKAGVCVECGEQYYPPGVVDKLRNIERSMVDKKRLEELDIIGNTYRVKYGVTF